MTPFCHRKRTVRQYIMISATFQVVLVLVGNKSDLEGSRAVPLAEAERYAKSVGAAHFQTSAKLNRGDTQISDTDFFS